MLPIVVATVIGILVSLIQALTQIQEQTLSFAIKLIAISGTLLLAMGMMMVSPMTISLPFKLLLFVLVDGWTKLIQGLILSYSL